MVGGYFGMSQSHFTLIDVTEKDSVYRLLNSGLNFLFLAY